MSTKVMVREEEGYSEAMLESMLHRTLFPSSFFDQPIPVRGVCFASGADSVDLARNFAEKCLGLGVISISPDAETEKGWLEMSRMFAQPQTTSSQVGILLPHLDQTSTEAQEHIAQAMVANNNLLWFPSVIDHRKLIPAIQLALVVYLGLGKTNKMQVLLQSDSNSRLTKAASSERHAPN